MNDHKIVKLFSNSKTSYDTFVGKYKGKRVFVKKIQDMATYNNELKIAKKLKREPGANMLITANEKKKWIVYSELNPKLWFQLHDAIVNKKKYKTLVEPIKYKLFDNIRKIMRKFHIQYNIVHHDLKPKNIMFTRKGGVKIIDYDSCEIIKKGTYVSLDSMVQDWRALISIFANIHFRNTLTSSSIITWRKIYNQTKFYNKPKVLNAFLKITTEFLDFSRYFV